VEGAPSLVVSVRKSNTEFSARYNFEPCSNSISAGPSAVATLKPLRIGRFTCRLLPGFGHFRTLAVAVRESHVALRMAEQHELRIDLNFALRGGSRRKKRTEKCMAREWA
jgi:hypothetical protein